MARPDSDHAARVAFDELTFAEKVQAIYRLADAGMSDYGLAHCTRLSVEQIRQILGERRARP